MTKMPLTRFQSDQPLHQTTSTYIEQAIHYGNSFLHWYEDNL